MLLANEGFQNKLTGTDRNPVQLYFLIFGEHMQSVQYPLTRTFLPQFDSQGNDITEMIKTFRIGSAKLKRDHLKVIVGTLVSMSAVIRSEPTDAFTIDPAQVSSVEAARHFGLYYREIGLVFETPGHPRKRITSGVCQVLCAEPNMTDSAILQEIRRNSDAGFQFFIDAQVVGFYRSDSSNAAICNSPVFA